MARPKTSSNGFSSQQIAHRTLVIDNGAYSIKAGFSANNGDAPPGGCHVVPNCIARSTRDKRTYIGSELDECVDFGELAFRRPVEKGYIVNWEGEKAIWDRSFFSSNASLRCTPEDTNLILTEAPNAPVPLQRNADEMVFEEFGFAAYYRTIAPTLNAYAPTPFPNTAEIQPGIPLECLLLVDAGYSHSTVTPLYQGRPFQQAIRRLEIGGKTLTNRLKGLISRTYEVEKEDFMVNEIKEQVCYVSQSFAADLEKTWRGGRSDRRPVDSTIVVDYVLPDYETIKHGVMRPHDPSVNLRNVTLGIGTEGGRREHILTLGNERFTVPELLFSPSDIGMQQEGLPATILQSINALPAGLRQTYLANILVVGGTSKLPGFVERLGSELRQTVDADLVVRVAQAKDPVKNAWVGGARMAAEEALLKRLVVTKAEYAENGEAWVRRKFAGKTSR